MNPTVAIVITTFRNPGRLDGLLTNMMNTGLPDVPVYVFEDPSPYEDREHVTYENNLVCNRYCIPMHTRPEWGCMQGIIQTALEMTGEDWIIYVPDDVRFIPGGLWNEYAGILTYGREFVGAIQAPYHNAHELVQAGVLERRDDMWDFNKHATIPRNPHWDWAPHYRPRKYVNVNGAGFSLNRALWTKMGGWPMCTWRLDEWVGYQAWINGMVCITLPGPPRLHYFGGASFSVPLDTRYKYSSVEAWQQAAGGRTPEDCDREVRKILNDLPEGWDGILDFFRRGKVLDVAA